MSDDPLLGGTGITHVLSYFIAVLNQVREGNAQTRHLHLVWNTRHSSHLQWIGPLINDALAKVPANLGVQIDLHVTKSPAGSDPDAETLCTMGETKTTPPGTSDSTPVNSPILRAADNEKMVVPELKISAPTKGLSSQAAAYVRWNAGRANITQIVQEDAEAAIGPMHVTGKWWKKEREVIADMYSTVLMLEFSLWPNATFKRYPRGGQNSRRGKQGFPGPTKHYF